MNQNVLRVGVTKMSYQLKIDPKSGKAARFISNLQKTIHKALVESGKTQQEVAETLGVDRSVVNRRLKGSANLTARSIAEFAFALDKGVAIEFTDRGSVRNSNWTGTDQKSVRPSNAAEPASRGTIEEKQKIKIERTAS